MRTHRPFVLVLALALAGGAGYALRAVASGIPSTAALTYSGVLETASGPASGLYNIEVLFFTAASGGAPVCDSIAVADAGTSVNVVDGHFSVLLPDSCAGLVSGNQNLWVDVLVGGADTGRTKIGAVPYAVEANHAPNADNAMNATNATYAGDAGYANSAGSATTANTANNVASTAWQLVPLTAAGLSEFTSGFGAGLQYRNVGDQTCLQGLLNVTAVTTTGTIATLPAGSLPAQDLVESGVNNDGFVSLRITTSGAISSATTLATGWLSFNNICFQHS